MAFPEVNFAATYYTTPLTVEYMRTGNFMWELSPYRTPEWEWYDPQFEESGLTLTVPYWIGRAFGFINATGVRIV